jgi:ATP-dependent helicase/nuclease subunit B
MMLELPRIYTIPPGLAFGRSLVKGLMHHYRDNLLALSDVQLYLPNRAACRAVQQLFLEESNGQATILPRLIPLYHSDEENLVATNPYSLGEDPFLRPDIDPLERQFIFMEMILKRQDIDYTPTQAFTLAKDLARLLDESILHDIDLNHLPNLVTGDLAIHWQKNMSFLSIIQEHWPKILEERHLMDPSRRQKLILQKTTESLKLKQPDQPIIFAGFTTFNQDSLELIDMIGRLPHGCVLLPCFDPDIRIDYWDRIDERHGYYHYKNLLNRYSMAPKTVTLWPLLVDITNVKQQKTCLIQDALQPINGYDLSDSYIRMDELDVDFIQVDNEHQEAKAISLIIRSTIETPDHRTLVVTPDATTTTLLKNYLKRWDINADHTNQKPIQETALFDFFKAIIQFTVTETPSTCFACLLKHPLLNKDKVELADIHQFEISHLRNALSLNSLFHDPFKDLSDELQTYLHRILETIGFTQEVKPRHFNQWLEDHILAAEALAGHADILWQFEGSETLAQFFIKLRQLPQLTNLYLTAQQYHALFLNVTATITCTNEHKSHPRLQIIQKSDSLWYDADTIILCRLNEGVWLANNVFDTWLPLSSKKELGFIDDSIAVETLLFTHLFCQSGSIISWPQEVDNTPQLASSWTQQIFAACQKNNTIIRKNNLQPLDWLLELDKPDRIISRSAPEPSPDLTLRPSSLSVTDMRDLISDPYSVYARKILHVKPLDDMDQDFRYRDWGTLVHRIIEEFIPKCKASNWQQLFDGICNKHMSTINAYPIDLLTWQQQLQRIGHELRHLFATETRHIHQEITGDIHLTYANGAITIHGRADMILESPSDLEIIDFKTGSAPSEKKIQSLIEPQLPLLAHIANNNGFKPIQNKYVSSCSYILTKGKASTILDIKNIKNVQRITSEVQSKLDDVIDLYYIQQHPYVVGENTNARYDTYAQLKRTAEWSSPLETEEDDDE